MVFYLAVFYPFNLTSILWRDTDILANPHFNRKIPWRLSSMQKARQRKRLRAVDKVVDTVSAALQRNGGLSTKAVDRWYKEMPREEEMLPKDKYTIFDRKEKKYRKGIHSMLNISYL